MGFLKICIHFSYIMERKQTIDCHLLLRTMALYLIMSLSIGLELPVSNMTTQSALSSNIFILANSSVQVTGLEVPNLS